MVERCIMIFPEFSNIEVINKIRDKYDPLAKHVRPHITLIFPFQSEISSKELREHLENVLTSVKPFHITLQGISAVESFGYYLFLNIVNGRDGIIDLNKRIYTDLLETICPPWLKHGGFTPHMTVGKLATEEEHKAAALAVKDINDVFETIVTKISVEIIDENEDSNIEMEIGLK